jgi:hypothetical protein
MMMSTLLFIGGPGEEGALVGTTTPSGPSPPRGSGVPVRKSKSKELSNKKTDVYFR